MTDIYKICSTTFDYFDASFKKIEADHDLSLAYVFCDYWIRGDDYPESIDSFVREKFKLTPNGSMLRHFHRLYKRSRYHVGVLLFISAAVFSFRSKNNQSLEIQNILFTNANRIDPDVQNMLSEALGENFHQLHLKLNLSDYRTYNGVEKFISRKIIWDTCLLWFDVLKTHMDQKLFVVSPIRIFVGLLLLNAYREFLQQVGTAKILITGSLTNPHVRRLCLLSEQLNIDCSLYIGRTVSPFSIPQLAGVKNLKSGVPTRIFCNNTYSKKLLDERIKKNKIAIIDLSNSKAEATDRLYNKNPPGKVLFILGLDEKFNKKIISHLINLTSDKKVLIPIVIRSHPLSNPKRFKRWLNNAPPNLSLSKRSSLDDDLIDASHCYLYPSMSFIDLLNKKIPFCWLVIDTPLLAFENLFWPSVVGRSLYELSELDKDLNNFCESDNTSNMEMLHLDDFVTPDEPYSEIAGFLKNA